MLISRAVWHRAPGFSRPSQQALADALASETGFPSIMHGCLQSAPSFGQVSELVRIIAPHHSGPFGNICNELLHAETNVAAHCRCFLCPIKFRTHIVSPDSPLLTEFAWKVLDPKGAVISEQLLPARINADLKPSLKLEDIVRDYPQFAPRPAQTSTSSATQRSRVPGAVILDHNCKVMASNPAL